MSDLTSIEAAIARYRADPALSPANAARRAIRARLDLAGDDRRSSPRGSGSPRTRIDSLVRFYSFLYDRPAGVYRLRLSDNVTDRMQGSEAMLARFLAAFGLKRGETSADGLVSVDLTSCTGPCDQGPGLLVNDRAIPQLTRGARR